MIVNSKCSLFVGEHAKAWLVSVLSPTKLKKKSMQFYENKVVFLEKYNIGSDKTSAGCLSKDFMWINVFFSQDKKNKGV